MSTNKRLVAASTPEQIVVKNWALKKISASGLDESDYYLLRFKAVTKNGSAALRNVFRAHPGLVIPYWNEDGTQLPNFRRIRWMEPLPLGSNGREMKYGQPARSQNELWLPVPLLTKAGMNVPVAIAEPTVPKLLTEGELKAACAAKFLPGYLSLAYSGISSWLQNKRPLPFFDRYGWGGHTFIICNDADVADNPNSRRSENQLAAMLVERGAKVLIARGYSKHEKARKMDDYIVRHGQTAFRKNILDTATEWKPSMAADPDLPAEIEWDAPDPIIDNSLGHIPPEAMHGECARLVQAMQLPPSLAYPAVLTMTAACCSPTDTSRIRPNLYCSLIADTGEAKSAVQSRIKEIARKYLGNRVVEFIPSSERGLINMFSYKKAALSDDTNGQLRSAADESVRQELKSVYESAKLQNSGVLGYLHVMDEMRSMMSKAAIQQSTLMGALTTLYYEDQVTGADKQGRFQTFPLRLCILGALKIKDATEFPSVFNFATTAGFYVRNIFGVSVPEEQYKHRWLSEDEYAKLEFKKKFSAPKIPDYLLARMQKWQEEAPTSELRKGRTGGRLGEIALRIAYITSIANGDRQVTDAAYRAAIKFVEWQERIRALYHPALGDTEESECMAAVLNFYEKFRAYNWRDACKRNNWYRKFPRAIGKTRSTLEHDAVLKVHKGKHYLAQDDTSLQRGK